MLFVGATPYGTFEFTEDTELTHGLQHGTQTIGVGFTYCGNGTDLMCTQFARNKYTAMILNIFFFQKFPTWIEINRLTQIEISSEPECDDFTNKYNIFFSSFYMPSWIKCQIEILNLHSVHSSTSNETIKYNWIICNCKWALVDLFLYFWYHSNKIYSFGGKNNPLNRLLIYKINM